MGFFTVSTLTGRVLFVLALIAHDRRRIVHVNVTEHPTAVWTARQQVEAIPEDSAPRWLLRDRECLYDDQARRRIASLGTTEVVSRPLSPWPNPYVERANGSIRRECLDHVIILNNRHLGRLLRAYLAYCHRSRTHLGLSNDAPDGKAGVCGFRSDHRLAGGRRLASSPRSSGRVRRRREACRSAGGARRELCLLGRSTVDIRSGAGRERASRRGKTARDRRADPGGIAPRISLTAVGGSNVGGRSWRGP
jgi:Integrase core domain